MLALTLLMLALTYLAPPLLVLLVGARGDGVRRRCLARHDRYRSCRLCEPTLPAARSRAAAGIALFYVAATVASAVLFWRGRGGYWKGRVQAPAPDST